MLRKTVLACLSLAFSVGLASADSYKGKLKSVDNDKKTITITIDAKDLTYEVAKDVKITALTRGKKKTTSENPVSGLTALTTGAEVTVNVEKKDDKDVATSIRQELMAKKKKKKTDN
jgi:hypothetical protein